jgi:hypothetical protein
MCTSLQPVFAPARGLNGGLAPALNRPPEDTHNAHGCLMPAARQFLIARIDDIDHIKIKGVD